MPAGEFSTKASYIDVVLWEIRVRLFLQMGLFSLFPFLRFLRATQSQTINGPRLRTPLPLTVKKTTGMTTKDLKADFFLDIDQSYNFSEKRWRKIVLGCVKKLPGQSGRVTQPVVQNILAKPI